MPRSRPRRSERRSLTLVASPSEQAPETTPVVNPRPRSTARQPNVIIATGLYVLRLGILGAGLGVLAGTVLTTFAPTRFLSPEALASKKMSLSATAEDSRPIKPQHLVSNLNQWLQEPKPVASAAPTASSVPELTAPQRSMPAPSQEMTALTQKLQALAKPLQPKIKPYAYFIDVDNGQYVNLAGTQTLPAASTIKLPIVIAFFEDVDAGKVMLQEQLPLSKDVIGSGSGDMQYQVGKVKSYSALETVTKMIVISDNTATNMLIKRLGGKQALNQRFQAWGLTQTVINNPLPDLEGTNKTSPQDLVKALIKIHQGDTLSLKSRDRLLNIMQGTKTRTLLPQGLETDAKIAHKTGDIGTLLGDAGIIDMPNGKRYIGAVMATRPYNDPAARTLIQNISRTVYQHFKGTTPPPPTVASKPVSKPAPLVAKPKSLP
ncbi:serine hydrolase [Synechocystis sp. LKSZ1]|uniref:serine hydrolase n=1 Tax=Synechocystis sp. LKSZ1 TaxID=3144951 RepID=UPI00336BEE43